MNKSKVILILVLVVVVGLASLTAYKVLKRPPARKILYYQSGMHPWIKSDKPGKCPLCGMDLMPVYEGQEQGQEQEQSKTRQVSLSASQLKNLNVQTAAVGYKILQREIRTVGEVAYDPELVVAQEEFVAALESGMLVKSSRRKLRLLGMSEQEIDQLAQTKQIDNNLILPEASMWVYADIYEQDLGLVKAGQQAKLTSPAFPDQKFYGQVTAIEPVLDKQTRSAKARLKVANPGLKLKPQMHLDVYLQTQARRVLAVPKNAVLDTGVRKVAYVEQQPGLYEARQVVIGQPAGDYLPVRSGLTAGEKVVTSANFLIDSQSQLSGGTSALYGNAEEIDHDR